MSTTEYMKNLMKDRSIASITPTSQAGVKEICGKMDFSKKAVVVEYGPATGVFTHYLLEHMTADSELTAIERNKNFARYLQENTDSDRLKIHRDSAENVADLIDQHGHSSVDYVISGIPFSLMSEYIEKEHREKDV
ncbi:class I SAM-dependent methyltransferase [Planococcus lenghuensis]|uniref:SAM-dependent methyltransferase n=1 Tax=Planococcus lenghuensis TaxID=2213202 RepID=A0A1Q2L4Q1_9BACL|nr:rRNA adenine N-6-methyltransferase family protein [Planococcus lenghuensis]AQQ54852.1 hypothetical protein B0X71_18260 [Planococcus lenghuensis]